MTRGFQCFGQAGAVFRQEADRAVLGSGAQRFLGGGHQALVGVQQGSRVVDFQPVTLGVLGTNSKRKAQHNGASFKVVCLRGGVQPLSLS